MTLKTFPNHYLFTSLYVHYNISKTNKQKTPSKLYSKRVSFICQLDSNNRSLYVLLSISNCVHVSVCQYLGSYIKCTGKLIWDLIQSIGVLNKGKDTARLPILYLYSYNVSHISKASGTSLKLDFQFFFF